MPAIPSPPAALRTVGIASPHFRATELAERAIAEGANAIEAALTAAVALTVLYPHQCSLGGDLVAVVRTPTGAVRSVMSVGAAALGIDASTIPGNGSRMVGRGAHTITVPGIVAGWIALAGDEFAPALAHAFSSAADLAERGEPVSAGLARALTSTWSIVGADPGMRAVFSEDGVPLGEGDILRQPRLAETLRTLADDPRAFYTGEVGRRIVESLSRSGSPLAEIDLRSHSADVAPSLAAVVDDVKWSVSPPPSQGIAFLALRVSGARGDGDLMDAAIAAAGVRDARLADAGPDGDPVTLDDFVAAIESSRDRHPETDVERPAGDTVAITAVDSDGWAVSIVQSIYQTFGSGICDSQTGIVFHNRGSAFSLDPGHPAHIAPGRRPPHTLTPVIAEAPGGDLIVMGCQGGRAQPWILAQLADRLIDPESDVASTLGADRWIFGGTDIDQPEPSIVVEGDVVPDGARVASARRGWRAVALNRQVDVAGHVQVARLVSGRVEAATDPRADGAARVLSGAPTSD